MGSFPDWVKLAEAYGATGVLLTDKTTLVDDLRTALATPGPVVVDVKVTREENTYPMIAPGAVPATTRVGMRYAGPRLASAAAAVSSLMVDAGTVAPGLRTPIHRIR